MSNNYDIIIVGGGPAGLTAALYSARAGKRVILFEKLTLGGQIAYSHMVENYPGLSTVNGADFGFALSGQAESFGAKIEYAEVLSVTPKDGGFIVATDSGDYSSSAVILAVGSSHRPLGLSEEESLVGAGVSYCAVCDGAFYSGREVAVIGGGSSAAEEALFLSSVCSKVTLVHRRREFRADESLMRRLRESGNVEILCPYTVARIAEDSGAVSGLLLKSTEDGSEKSLPVSGVFVAVGQIPQTDPFRPLGICGESGYFNAGETTVTTVPGLFVAGDCREKELRQLTTACADGAVAALRACRYIEGDY